LIALSGSCVTHPPITTQDVDYQIRGTTAIAKEEVNSLRPDVPSGLLTNDNIDTRVAKPISLSLHESISIALKNNRQILITQEGKNRAKGQLKEANAQLYPWLTANASYRRIDEVTKFSADGLSITIGALNNYRTELSLQQPLYTGGRIHSGIKLAQLGIQYTDEDFRNAEESVIFLTTKAYYDILLAREMMETDRRSLEVTQAHLDDVTKKHTRGVVSNYDLLRAKVQVANINALYLKSVNSLHLARTYFINILGLPLEQDEDHLELTDKFVYEPTEAQIEEKVLTEAFQNRSDIAQVRLRVEMQKQNLALARAEAGPTLALFGNWGGEQPSQKVFGEDVWKDYWSTGATLSLPLFEGWRIKGRVIQEKSVLRQAQLSQRDIEEKVRLEVRQSLLNLKDAEELVKSQQENVKQAEEGLRLAQLGYEQGVYTQLEVMDAQMALDSARKNMAEALYAHMLAKVMLRKAMGKLSQR
jgi:outer membrane protein TolC